MTIQKKKRMDKTVQRKKRMDRRKSKFCQFCKIKADEIDYKDVGKLKRHTSGRGKLLSSKLTGNCAKHQRMLTKAIKRARYVGLLPYIKV
jgi:small subunit ribosomal protein S18